jgi:hypothetical protein
MVMLDLRGGDETSLVDTARQLYRSRLPRRIVAVDPTQPQRPQQGPGRTGTN